MKTLKKIKGIVAVILFCSFPIFAQIDQICKELAITKSSIGLELLTSKTLDKTIKIYAIPVVVEKDQEYWIGDLVLVKYDTVSKKILMKTRFERFLTSDALEIHHIWIDTAPYILQYGIRSFGIRISSYNNSRASSAEIKTLFLFEERDANFREVMSIITNRSIFNGGGECENTQAEKSKSLIIIDKTNIHNQHYNLIEKLRKENYNLTKDCEDGEKKIENIVNVFTFEDGRYICKKRQD